MYLTRFYLKRFFNYMKYLRNIVLLIMIFALTVIVFSENSLFKKLIKIGNEISNIKFIHTDEIFLGVVNKKDLPKKLKRHAEKPNFQRFSDLQQDALLLLSRYDGDNYRGVVDLVDFNTFEVLHTYKHDIDEMNKLAPSTPRWTNNALDNSQIRAVYCHPLIFSNGDLVSHPHNGPLFRISPSGELLWTNFEYQFHHSINFDAELRNKATSLYSQLRNNGNNLTTL